VWPFNSGARLLVNRRPLGAMPEGGSRKLPAGTLQERALRERKASSARGVEEDAQRLERGGTVSVPTTGASGLRFSARVRKRRGTALLENHSRQFKYCVRGNRFPVFSAAKDDSSCNDTFACSRPADAHRYGGYS
jgi:hypothetical protein